MSIAEYREGIKEFFRKENAYPQEIERLLSSVSDEQIQTLIDEGLSPLEAGHLILSSLR